MPGNVLAVVVGDMIDRASNSAGALRALCTQSIVGPADRICLMGNHERMLLGFLEAPARHEARWLAHGGTNTSASFGLSPWTQRSVSRPKARPEALAAD